MAKTLAIIGGGAKAAAIVARAAVLRDLLGEECTPRVLVFEQNSVGSAWRGDGGFSSGFLTLCSPAEKDVGFPYGEVAPTYGGVAVGPKLYSRFSWQSFLVSQGRYAAWVDRGRDHPSHELWADYLAWVFVNAQQSVVSGQVTQIEPAKDGWTIRYTDEDGPDETLVDGVVLTGAGEAREIKFSSHGMPAGRILDARTFWGARSSVLEHREIAVAGAGGAAGAIIAWLARALVETPAATVHNVSPMGTLFPRGDGYAERRWFSDPSDWKELTKDHRRKLLERTEEGVISARNKRMIDEATNINYVRGRAVDTTWDGSELRIHIDYDGQSMPPLKADCLINAIGFDAWSLLKLVNRPTAAGLANPSSSQRQTVMENMLPNLSFSASAGLGDNLHVPSLAGLAHGPGMGTLGCLGLVAKSILDGYLT